MDGMRTTFISSSSCTSNCLETIDLVGNDQPAGFEEADIPEYEGIR